MIEILALFGLALAGLAVIALFAAIGFVLKVVFKIALIPLWFLGVLLKGLLLLVGIALALVFLPVLLIVLVVAGIPLLLLAGIAGVGWAVVAA